MGLAVAVGFSPVIVGLVGHLWAHPWTRPSLLFPLLFLRLLRRPGRPAPTSQRQFLLLVVAGGVVELLAVAYGAPRFGRIGLPLAVVGLAVGLGGMRVGAAALAFWWIPVPTRLLELGSPTLEAAWAGFAAGASRLFMLDTVAVDAALVGSGGMVVIEPRDNGIWLAVLLAGLGWYRAAREDKPFHGLVASASVFACAGVLLQVALLGAAAAALGLGASASFLRMLLDHAGWLALASGIVVLWRGQLEAHPRREVHS